MTVNEIIVVDINALFSELRLYLVPFDVGRDQTSLFGSYLVHHIMVALHYCFSIDARQHQVIVDLFFHLV